MSTLKYAVAIMLVSGAAVSHLAWADRYGHGGYGGGYGGGHIGIVIGGPVWGWPYYPPSYYYPAYPPNMVIESPPVYVEQAAPPSAQVPDNYWYYCSSPEGYYPYIKECPAGWQKVVPQPPPHP